MTTSYLVVPRDPKLPDVIVDANTPHAAMLQLFPCKIGSAGEYFHCCGGNEYEHQGFRLSFRCRWGIVDMYNHRQYVDLKAMTLDEYQADQIKTGAWRS